jgi:ribosomal protein S27E
MLQVKCPNCDAPMPYVAELANRTVLCLGCGAHFAIPDLGPMSLTDEPQPGKLIKLDARFPIEPTEDFTAQYPDKSEPERR